jgi:hypothetical protein
LIGGTTIHSLFGLSIDKNTIINKSKTILNSWSNIQFMIIDENINDGLCDARYNAFKITKIKI